MKYFASLLGNLLNVGISPRNKSSIEIPNVRSINKAILFPFETASVTHLRRRGIISFV